MSNQIMPDPLSPEEKRKRLFRVYEYILSDQFTLAPGSEVTQQQNKNESDEIRNIEISNVVLIPDKS
jgi:hypothetical protein